MKKIRLGVVVRWIEHGCLGRGVVVKLNRGSAVVEDLLTLGRKVRVKTEKLMLD